MITVADCERVQTDWFRYRATNLGGAVWEDGPLTWTDGPDGLNLMFPAVLTDATLLRGLLRAGTRPIGAWLGLDVDPEPLLRAGFERGWSPWWMAGDVSGFDPGDLERHARGQAALRDVRLPPDRRGHHVLAPLRGDNY